jgi:IS30 family transposase
MLYSPKKAQERYDVLLVSSRKGPYVADDTLLKINDELKQYMKLQRQSLYHLPQHTELGVSASSIYRYIQNGYLPDISNIDLPRKIRYRVRVKHTSPSVKENKKVKYKGRTYAGYLTYMKKKAQ